jgi:hypothetical protein
VTTVFIAIAVIVLFGLGLPRALGIGRQRQITERSSADEK